MAAALSTSPLLASIQRHRGMLLPAAVIGLLLVILVPLPPHLLDLLLIGNLTLSIVVLTTTVFAQSPLELAVFPSLLLGMTLLRLVLSVATTRLVLTAPGAAAASPQALHAAGEVVLAFSNFVTGGSLAVGVIIFSIIAIIQFVVITKGASRISEVAARFVLDALPGKQMAVDADLASGSITEAEARQRRQQIGQEADFYGAMDGASKFVRGDAIAAVIIILVNIVGGLYVGLVERDWQLMDCLRLFTRLTIGDGLVTQVPALIVSLAAGLLVTRTGSKSSLGDDLVGQVFAKPKALAVAAVFMGVLLFSSLPKLPLLAIGGCCAALAWVMNNDAAAAARAQTAKAQATPKPVEKIEKLLDVEAMELEIGPGLVRLADSADEGDLMDRIAAMRRRAAIELGIVVPAIRVRDELQLSANDYVIKIRGQAVARGAAYPEQFLAVDVGRTGGAILGATPIQEPVAGLAAYWITEPQVAEAQGLGFRVDDAPTVLMAHLAEVVRAHAHELLTRQEVKSLLDNLKARAPALVDEMIPSQVKPGELQRVMQNLLRERVSVRDLETILETIGETASRTKDLEILTEYARVALARTICKQHVDEQDRLWCVTLDPELEQLIGRQPAAAPTARKIVEEIRAKVSELIGAGRPAVILCSPQVRPAVRRMIEPAMPRTAVLAYSEVAGGVAVRAVSMVALEPNAPADVPEGAI